MSNQALVITITIIMAIAYSFIVHLFGKGKRWDWWNTLSATIISVMGAMIVGLWLYNQQIKYDNIDRTNKYKILLTAEISQILFLLEDRYQENCSRIHSKDYGVLNISSSYVQPLILEDAARSGLFSADISAGMLVCAQQIRMHNRRIEEFDNYSNSPKESKLEKNIKGCAGYLDGLRTSTIDNLKHLSEELQLPVQKFIQDNFLVAASTFTLTKNH